MPRLSLSIPERSKGALPPDVRPKRTQAWLASLPAANTVDTARKIFLSLFNLNRSEVDAETRLELVQLYRGPIDGVSATLQGHLINLGFPLSGRQRELAQFLWELHAEMAAGYKAVVTDCAQGRRGALKNEQAALAIERAIAYLGRVLLHCYHVYMPCPPQVWREIHALFAFAEEQGWQDTPLDAVDGPSSVRLRYQQVALLGLSNPYQLQQNECHRVFSLLRQWADKAVMAAELNVGRRAGNYLVDLTADAPPILFPRDVKLPPNPALRVLNTAGLANTAQGLIHRARKDESIIKNAAFCADMLADNCLDMLQRLVKIWGAGARRHFSRLRRHGRLSVCLGINAVHFFASGQQPFRFGDDADRFCRARGILSSDDDAAAVVTPLPQENFRLEEWTVRDESAGGFALMREGRVGLRVRVGDVLGIENQDLGQWRLAIARWMKSPDEDRVELGIEMLAPSVEPVAVKTADREVEFTQGLLLPPLPALRKPATLLVRRGVYAPGRNLYLQRGDGPAELIRPLRVIERTNAFEQLSFVAAAVSVPGRESDEAE